jgi:hypothetical protein
MEAERHCRDTWAQLSPGFVVKGKAVAAFAMAMFAAIPQSFAQ